MGPKTLLMLVQLTSSLMAALGKAPGYCNTSFYRNPAEVKKTVEYLSSWTPDSEVSPWELGDLLESDIMVTDEVELKLMIRDPKRKWPNGVLPYFIVPKHFSDHEKRIIHSAIRQINKVSCVRLRNATAKDKDFVRVTGGKDGCHSFIGREGGAQRLNLQPPVCVRMGVVYHEFLHALGFHHEHNAPSRDNYIRILWKNIKKGKAKHFYKRKPQEVTDYEVGYDLSSVMHYGRKVWSKNNRSTIEPLDKNAEIGLRNELSEKDIAKLKRHYNCP